MPRERSAAVSRATRTPGSPGRWYTHHWNSEISWKLILGILPRIPVPLRPPIHFAVTLVCFVALPTERRAARRNLERVTGRRGLAGLISAFRLFYNFSKFMAGFIDLCPFQAEAFEGRVRGADETTRTLRAALEKGRGLVVLTLHQGHYETGLALLSGLGVPVTVAVQPEEPEGVARFEERARSQANVRVLHLNDSNLAGLELMLALRRNEIVALQADRSPGSAVRRVPFFGASADLPIGPLLLASTARAPLLLVVTLIRGHRRYELIFDGPFDPPPSDERNPPGEGALETAHDELVHRMESMILRAPEQWFNFFEVWPRAGPARGEAGR